MTVTLTATALRIEQADGGSLWWPYDEIRQAQAFQANEPVRMERGHRGEAIVIAEDAFLQALRTLAPGAGHLRDAARRRRRLLAGLGGALAAAAAAVALYLWSVPLLARRVAASVPPSWEESIGRPVAAQLEAIGGRCDDPRLAATVDSIVARLAAATPTAPYTFRVSLTNSGVINAFAAPGGYMVVNRGLLERTARPEELAGVLAHEMAHVVERHGTQAVLREIPMQLLLSMLSGDLAALGRTAQTAGALALVRYRRDDESAADREGMALMQRAGVDPSGLIGFFEMLRREAPDVPEGLSYFSTHPTTASRIARLRALADSLPVAARPLPGAGDWRRIAAACRQEADSQ